jgi:tRNA A-37 threonylcarbamoyl transferase component Bud32
MPPPLPPRYRFLQVLGRGATAEVILAQDVELEREVAIKLLAPELGADPSVPERFAREAILAARLGRHPHVVAVYDVGEWSGRPYIVMEYERGGGVDERLRAGRVSHAEALRWLRETAEAVDEAHANGVVHRDLKPANLLLDERDSVHVADFGIARAVGDALKRLTMPGTILGTAGYLSPEQARGESATAASDLYSLAVVAYELLHGQRPDGRALDPLFAQALAPEPERRFRTAAAFVDALEGQDCAPTVVQLPPAAAAPDTFSHPTAILRRRRSTGRAVRYGKRLMLVTLVGAFAAGGAVAFGYVRADSPAVVTCTVSPSDHDANLVVRGVGADDYCASRARELSWATRPGFALRSPDLGEKLTVVCSGRDRGMRITIYDDGGRRIGQDLCDQLAPVG